MVDETDGAAVLLEGRRLRYWLSLVLRDLGSASVHELVDHVERSGRRVAGRPAKTVSDALRWEIAHGRVIRTGWGRYAVGHIPRSTVHWMQREVANGYRTPANHG